MAWWQILLCVVVGVFVFDGLFIGLLFLNKRPQRGCLQTVPDVEAAGQRPKESLWTTERGGD